MAITVVNTTGSTEQTAGASYSVTLSATPSVGNSLLIGVVFFEGTTGDDITGITDNQTGNTYSKIVESSDVNGLIAEIWACESIAGASGTFTLTLNCATGASNYITVGIAEVSGLASSSFTDVTDTATLTSSTTTPLIGPTTATSQADEIVLAVLNIDGGNPGGISSPTGYTNVYVEQSNQYAQGSVDYQILSATGAQTAQWSVSNGSGPYTAMALATFKASTGATYGVTVAESGSITDTSSASAAFAPHVTETTSASDTVSALAVFASTIAESGTALDTSSALAEFVTAIAESGSATDTTTGGLLQTSAIAESVSATDTSSAIAHFVSSLVETGSALDVPSAQATFSAGFAEHTTTSDTVSALALFATVISEHGTATDTTSALALFSAVMAESGSVTDTVSGGELVVASLTETATATDTPSATAQFSSDVTELESVADTASVTVQFVSSVTESGAALDTSTAAALFASIVAEVTTVLDALSASVTLAPVAPVIKTFPFISQYAGIQQIIDFGRGLAANVVGQPGNVYRLSSGVTGAFIQSASEILQNFTMLRAVTHGGKSMEAKEGLGTLYFNLVCDLNYLKTGDVWVQNDPNYGTGATLVNFPTDEFIGVCLTQHAVMKPSLGMALNRYAYIYRPQPGADTGGYAQSSQQAMLGFSIAAGLGSFGAESSATEIPIGLMPVSWTYGAQFTPAVPGTTPLTKYFCYIPPIEGYLPLEGDIIQTLNGARYGVVIPWHLDAGVVGSSLLVERYNAQQVN